MKELCEIDEDLSVGVSGEPIYYKTHFLSIYPGIQTFLTAHGLGGLLVQEEAKL